MKRREKYLLVVQALGHEPLYLWDLVDLPQVDAPSVALCPKPLEEGDAIRSRLLQLGAVLGHALDIVHEGQRG